MQKIIELKNVTAYRGQTRVFNDLSLEIAQGCNTAILGPNGAGKSTLLKLLSRDIYPVQREGSYVRVFGRERWNVWALRTHFGIVSHDLQQQYVGNAQGMNVILSGYYSSIDTAAHQQFSAEDKERANRIVQKLGVTELKERMFSAMSTGEQRRFLLGRALINNPDALVLDEPTSGLDLKACFQYLDIVRGLMQSGKTIILVTHHIHEIPPEVSRVVLLKNGEVIADGEKPEILTSKNLSSLFATPIELVRANGFYQAMPGRVCISP
ncbi:MAG TPA: ATP-binding cassette domain-containing protein [Candidatus Binatia bacterium]|jgi:iron complex transport system ATP-binding protein|nr:ATP-binding cassette domain-containing protein [Candidatus Binatia bacterium]